MAKMRHQNELLIPAGTSLVFKPGDFHLMMMGPKTALHKNDEVAITLGFKNAGVIEEIEITLPVKSPSKVAKTESQQTHSTLIFLWNSLE